MSSSEDPGDSVADTSEALSLLLQRLKSSETLAKNILARHRRSRENAGALSRLLTSTARKMDEVEALLADADRVVDKSEKGKVVAQKPRANAQSKRHRKEKPLVEPSVQAILSASEDHQNDADLNSESDAEENVVASDSQDLVLSTPLPFLVRAIPKSPSLTRNDAVSKKLAGLISRWITIDGCLECKYSIANAMSMQNRNDVF